MNDKEKNASIEYILSQGLVQPQTARSRITEMIRVIGFRYIFWDMRYSLFFIAVTAGAIVALFINSPDHYRYSASIVVAPLLFLLISVFDEITERSFGIYELKQTCRYTIRHITALRMMCYGIVGTVFTALITVMSTGSAYEFLSIFPLCLAALSICAGLSLTVMCHIRSKWVCTGFSSAWVFLNLVPAAFRIEAWEAFLRGFPVAVSCVIAAAGFVLFALQISKMLSEVNRHAFTQ
jgi:hypothetical protein